jgi:uncharacterized protein (DUF58 family)
VSLEGAHGFRDEPAPSARPATGLWRIGRIRDWWDARHPPADSLLLTQRNVYILPTRGGWLWALLVLMLLVGAINYQLNLGYLLCFVLAGVALVSMHSCHATLRGLRLHLVAPEPVHAGQNADLVVSLAAERGGRGARYGIGIRLDLQVALAPPSGSWWAIWRSRAAPVSPSPGIHPGAQPAALSTIRPDLTAWTWVDVAATASSGLLGRFGQFGAASAGEPPATLLHLALPCPERGWHELPRLQLETRFPFGLFRAWTVWRPAARVLVWPAPEMPTPPWPLRVRDASTPHPLDRPAAQLSTNPLDADSARPYRVGDSPREVLWKKSASSIASGATPALVSRTGSAAAPQASLDFDWLDASPAAGLGRSQAAAAAPRPAPATAAGQAGVDADGEARLSRLTAWVLAADRAELAWTLRLPGRALARSNGPAHRRACLDALAHVDLRHVQPDGRTGSEAGGQAGGEAGGQAGGRADDWAKGKTHRVDQAATSQAVVP